MRQANQDDTPSRMTRRGAILTLGTAIAATAVPLAIAAPTTSDPIFERIEAHRKAEAHFSEASGLPDAVWIMNGHRDGPEYEAAEAKVAAAEEAGTAAAWNLLDYPPTTLAGVIALLRYSHEYCVPGQCWPDGWEHELHATLADALQAIAPSIAPQLVAVSTAPDPMLAAIEAERTAAREANSLGDSTDEEVEEKFNDLCDVARDCWGKMMRTVPTTTAGLLAFLRYVRTAENGMVDLSEANGNLEAWTAVERMVSARAAGAA